MRVIGLYAKTNKQLLLNCLLTFGKAGAEERLMGPKLGSITGMRF